MMSDLSAPQQAAALFIEAFNSEDPEALNRLSSAPWVFVFGTNPVVFDKYSDAINFPAMKANGWNHSRVDANKLIYEDSDTAMVQLTVTRLTKENEVQTEVEVLYVLVKEEGQWKPKVAFTNSSPGPTDK
jgi:ketosteroid isomerase-like protein